MAGRDARAGEILEQLPEAVLVLDLASGRVEFANAAARGMLGPLDGRAPVELFGEGLRGALDRVARGESVSMSAVPTPAGRPVELRCAPLRDPPGAPRRAVAQLRIDRGAERRDERRGDLAALHLAEGDAELARAELVIAHESLATQFAERGALERGRDELRRQLASAEERERLRLSRELHDQMGQLVTALLLGLKGLEAELHPAPPALAGLERLAEEIAREVHQIALELRPPALDRLGLRQALQAHLEEWSDRHGVATDFQALGPCEERFPIAVETVLYRVVQEGLTNVAKHAGATRVSLIVERRPGSVGVILEDDGRGIDLEHPPIPGRATPLGLLGMQERVERLGGSFDVESAPGLGTTIFARLPDQPDEAPFPRETP